VRIGRPGSRVGERLSRVFDLMTASLGKESKKCICIFTGVIGSVRGFDLSSNQGLLSKGRLLICICSGVLNTFVVR